MGNKMIDKAVNPFIQIAGARALAWGALGLLVSTVICYYAGYHYHGLLHFGPAPNPAWWCYAAEHLIVWLIPALLFWAARCSRTPAFGQSMCWEPYCLQSCLCSA